MCLSVFACVSICVCLSGSVYVGLFVFVCLFSVSVFSISGISIKLAEINMYGFIFKRPMLCVIYLVPNELCTLLSNQRAPVLFSLLKQLPLTLWVGFGKCLLTSDTTFIHWPHFRFVLEHWTCDRVWQTLLCLETTDRSHNCKEMKTVPCSLFFSTSVYNV